jgi:hypothetical protein
LAQENGISGADDPNQISTAFALHFPLCSIWRHGGGGRRHRSILGKEATIMIVIGILLSVVAAGFLCWALFTLAVYALPFCAAVTAGMYIHHDGGGPVGVIGVAAIAGIVTLIAGQLIFSTAHSQLIRLGLALLFAAPAAIAGYHATHGIVAMTIPSEIWQQVLAVIGSIIVGATAWTRMALLSPRPVASGNAGRPYLR